MFVNDAMGEAFIPQMFGEDAKKLLAALDWARVFAAEQDNAMAAIELRAVADAARAIAEMAKRVADSVPADA
jgi:hypothetical protein